MQVVKCDLQHLSLRFCCWSRLCIILWMDTAFCRTTTWRLLKVLAKKQHFRCVISTKYGRRWVSQWTSESEYLAHYLGGVLHPRVCDVTCMFCCCIFKQFFLLSTVDFWWWLVSWCMCHWSETLMAHWLHIFGIFQEVGSMLTLAWCCWSNITNNYFCCFRCVISPFFVLSCLLVVSWSCP